MKLDIFIIGIIIIALFVLPFYFVVRASRKADKNSSHVDEETVAPTSDKKKTSRI